MVFMKFWKKKCNHLFWVQFSQMTYEQHWLCRIVFWNDTERKICALLPQFYRSSSTRTHMTGFVQMLQNEIPGFSGTIFCFQGLYKRFPSNIFSYIIIIKHNQFLYGAFSSHAGLNLHFPDIASSSPERQHNPGEWQDDVVAGWCHELISIFIMSSHICLLPSVSPSHLFTFLLLSVLTYCILIQPNSQ